MPSGKGDLYESGEPVCPYCGSDAGSKRHKRYGIQKLGRYSAEGGIPLVGRMQVQRERLLMVYVCERTNLPFFVDIVKATRSSLVRKKIRQWFSFDSIKLR